MIVPTMPPMTAVNGARSRATETAADASPFGMMPTQASGRRASADVGIRPPMVSPAICQRKMLARLGGVEGAPFSVAVAMIRPRRLADYPEGLARAPDQGDKSAFAVGSPILPELGLGAKLSRHATRKGTPPGDTG